MNPDAADPWDGYLIGPENALAHAGAVALARGEPHGASPLVFFGPSGVGKSRLLAGLATEHLRRSPAATRLNIAAEAFAVAVAEAAARPEGWAQLRGRFRRLDLLVLDDLPTLERTPWAWEELGHTLDALEERGAAVAIASRMAPGIWARRGWPGRLVSRLTGGLAIALESPGVESRRRYVLDQLRRLLLVADPEIVERIVEAADGYRAIDGWLARLALLRRLDPRLSGPELLARTFEVEEADPTGSEIGHIVRDSRPDLASVTRAVADALGVRVGDLRSESRHASIAEARHLAMHLARRHTGASVRAIGAFFGGRDPATVRHADRAAALRLAADPALAALAAGLARSWPVMTGPEKSSGETSKFPPRPRGQGRG